MAKILTEPKTRGQRIQKLRKEKGLTQAMLGKEIGVSGGFISQLESDDSDTSPAVLEALADFFGVTVDYLQGRIPTGYTDKEISPPVASEVLTPYTGKNPKDRRSFVQLGANEQTTTLKMALDFCQRMLAEKEETIRYQAQAIQAKDQLIQILQRA